MSQTSFRLVLPAAHRDAIVRHARAELPNECCGLLAGAHDRAASRKWVVDVFPLVNERASPTRYQSEPRSILNAYKEIDRQGLDVVGTYHSHPTSPPVPSRIDLENNTLGDDVVHVIVSLVGDSPELRAWRLFERSYEEIELVPNA